MELTRLHQIEQLHEKCWEAWNVGWVLTRYPEIWRTCRCLVAFYMLVNLTYNAKMLDIMKLPWSSNWYEYKIYDVDRGIGLLDISLKCSLGLPQLSLLYIVKIPPHQELLQTVSIYNFASHLEHFHSKISHWIMHPLPLMGSVCINDCICRVPWCIFYPSKT